MQNDQLLEDAAIKYTEEGYAVIPLNSKAPATKTGKKHENATKDPAVVREWWSSKFKRVQRWYCYWRTIKVLGF